MKFNGKLQLHTFLRIAICLLVGICIGDATADAVPVALWRWLFVGLLSLLVLLHMSKRLEMMQTLLIFSIVIVGGAWRIASYENSLRCAFTGEEEVYEAVVVSQPIKKRRSMKCELAVVSGRLAGHRLNAYFQNPNSLNHIVVGDGLIIRQAGVKQLGIIPESFRRLGIKLYIKGDDILIPAQKHYQIESFIDGSFMTLADAPWPGLTPDLLSVLIVVATQARGTVLFHQKMFESRLFFVDKLIEMGAQIILCDPHRAVVVGHDHKIKLRGRRMVSPDIRAGIALLIAALSADGTSKIDNVEQIDRGYECIEERLNQLGAHIQRV